MALTGQRGSNSCERHAKKRRREDLGSSLDLAEHPSGNCVFVHEGSASPEGVIMAASNSSTRAKKVDASHREALPNARSPSAAAPRERAPAVAKGLRRRDFSGFRVEQFHDNLRTTLAAFDGGDF